MCKINEKGLQKNTYHRVFKLNIHTIASLYSRIFIFIDKCLDCQFLNILKLINIKITY